MKKLLSSLAFVAISTLLSSHASAGLTTWTNTMDVNAYVGVGGHKDYTHNLTLGTQSPFPFLPSGMTAVKGSLEIQIYDDTCVGGFLSCLGNTVQEAVSPEIVLFLIEDFDFDTGSVQFSLANFSANLGINALASINSDGMLDITIQSLGDDFRIGSSKLTVEGVPEPEMLGLMGLSLVTLAMARRRKALAA